MGYAPTPEKDEHDERLYMRRAVNRILIEFKMGCLEESFESIKDNVPKELQTILYALRIIFEISSIERL